MKKGNVHTFYCHSDYHDYDGERNSESKSYEDEPYYITGTSYIAQNITSTIYSNHYVSYELEGFFCNTTQVLKEEKAK